MVLSLGDLTRRSRSRGAHADPPKAAGAKHRSAGRWAAWRGRGASVRGAAEMWGSDRRGAHLRHLPEGLARLCISFFYFVLFLEAFLLRVRGRTGSDSWGAQRSLSSDTSPPPTPARLPSPAAPQVVRRRMLGINCAICWPGAMGASQLVCFIRDTVTDKYKLSEDQNTRENNSHR